MIAGSRNLGIYMSNLSNSKSDNSRVAALNADEAAAFADFTYPRLAGEIRQLSPPWIAVGAWAGGQPAGLALGRVESSGAAELTSLFVKPDMRGGGIARQLVSGLMETLRSRDAHVLSARIAGRNPSRPALDRTLTRLGWPSLCCVEIKVAAFAGVLAQQGEQWKGMQGKLLATGGVTFDGWVPFEDRDRNALDSVLARAGFNGTSRRFLAIEGLEPQVSVIVRRAGVPVGWVVGRRSVSPMPARSAAPSITYTSAWVEPSLARRGVLIAGFWHAVTRQAEAYGPDSIAIYQTGTPRMVALSQKRFAPLALQSDEVFATTTGLR